MKRAIMVASLLSIGCSPDPADVRVSGELTNDDETLAVDQSKYDEHELEVEEGWRITVELESTAFDAYAHLIDPDGEQVAQNDDAAPGTTNARIEHVAAMDGTYRALANARDQTGRGAYVVHIVTARP